MDKKTKNLMNDYKQDLQSCKTVDHVNNIFNHYDHMLYVLSATGFITEKTFKQAVHILGEEALGRVLLIEKGE